MKDPKSIMKNRASRTKSFARAILLYCPLPTAYCLLALCLLASLAVAQRSPKKHNQPSKLPPVYEVPKDQEDLSGRFTFARVRFDVGSWWAGLPLGDQGPPWSHDYP